MIVEAPDRDLTRRIIDYFVDQLVLNPWCGRESYKFFQQAGLKSVVVADAATLVLTDFSTAKQLMVFDKAANLMREDEAATVKTIAAYRGAMASLIKQHRGRVVDSPGDNLFAEFSNVIDAVQCAVAVQNEFQTRNAELAENRRMEFRIGINLGDVIDEEDRIYGDGVNVAARLEALADPWLCLFSHHKQCRFHRKRSGHL